MNGNISKFKGVSGDGIGNQIEALVPEIGYANLIDTYIPRQKAAKLYRIEKGSVMNEDGEPGISLDRGYYYIVALGVWEGAGEGEPLTRQYRLDADGFYCRDYIVHIGGENEWTPWKDISNFPMSLVAGREMEIEKGIFVQAEDGATIIGDLRERLYDSDGVPVEGNVATGLYSLATGMAATATGDMSISLGGQSRAAGYGSMAMGSGAEASGYGAVAVGLLAKALADYTTVIGEGSEARGKGAVCLGDLTDANGDWALAIGYGVTSNAELSIAIGSFMTKANGKNSVAIGTNVEAISPGSVVIGNSNVRDNDDKYAIILANGRGRLNNALTIDWEDKAEFSGDVYIKGKRALRDGDVVIDSALNETSENPVQNKVVTESINEVRASVTSLTDATTSTVKCHVGDAIPNGTSVILKYVHSPSGNCYNTDGSAQVTTVDPDVNYNGKIIMVGEDVVASGWTGLTIGSIGDWDCTGTDVGSYDENWYAVFEVTTKGAIPTLEERIAALEAVIANIQNAEEASF